MSASALAAGIALADASTWVSVANEKYVRLHNAYNKTSRVEAATNGVSALTLRQDVAYPTAVSQPAFWVDCSDTTGWKSYEQGGVTYVTNIPSKVGSKLAGTRWLTNEPGGGDWVGWYKGTLHPYPPMYVANETALGEDGHYLDFGDQGACRGLLFNTDGAGYNALTNIGTVIAIWGTDVRNGGHLLGGGSTYLYGWHRASDVLRDVGTYHFSTYMFNGHAQASLKNGVVWHDGNIGVPIWTGYVGGWEVLSLQCAAANVQASGIGVNDKRNGLNAEQNMTWVSSGQEVAELLIYDAVLTRDEIAKVEVYLEQKWFGRARTGWNGLASTGVINAYQANFQGEINVPADETLEITQLIGGSQYNKSTLPKMTKTGAGTLVFSSVGAQDYAAEFVFGEGTISYPALKETPTLDQLPAHLYARFDASDLTSVTTDDEGRVSKWANLSTDEDAIIHKRAFALRQNTVDYQPTVIADEMGEGLNVIDFGANVSSGKRMVFSTNETAVASNPAVEIAAIQTVVAFIGAQEGGGSLFNNAAFQRKNANTHDFRDALLSYDPATNVKGTDLKFWSNGRPWDATRGYETPGYQVVAYQTHGNGMSQMMKSYIGNYYGGARIGEVLIWNRSLTEAEVRDVQAYLMAKWLKRDTPGYARPAGQFVAMDLQNVTVPAGSRVTLDVAEGRTIRIGKLTVAGELIKAGAGTVEVEQTSFLLDGHVTTLEGEVVGVGVRDVASSAELAPGATLHLDASDASHMYTKVRSGDKAVCVSNWRDQNDKIGIWSYYYSLDRSAYVTTAADGCNGKGVVDFGFFGSKSTLTNSTNGGSWMPLDHPIHSMRDIYAVIKYHGGTDEKGQQKVGFLFGNGDGRNDAGERVYSYPWDEEQDISFHPGLTYSLWDGRFLGGYNNVFAGDGNCRTNGVAVGWNSFKIMTNVFQLVELHPTAGVPGGVMGRDRHNGDRMGGFAIAEIVAYEHPLSEREKVATRNYLMRKWLDPNYGDALPDAPEKPEIVEYEITVDGEKTFENDADVEKVRVKGEGTLTKTGEGTLTVKDLSEFSGTVNVNEGTLEVLYADPYATPNLPKDGILYQADATRGLTTTTNDNVISVSEWANYGSAPLKAVKSKGNAQYVVFDKDVGYRPTVDLPTAPSCFVWQKADGSSTDIQTLSGIRSIFWMIGSQNGGGFLMGGGTNETGTLYYYWHRGIYYPNPPATTPNYVGSTNLSVLLHSGANVRLRNASWWKNGTKVKPQSEHLSGKWDQLSMVVASDAEDVNASGFAYDGRSQVPPQYQNAYYNAHQRIAEIICYDRRVSTEEREGIECYLRCKWLNDMHAAATNVIINVAGDATVTLGGDQTFGGITGTGTITGTDVTVTAGAFTATTNGAFTVNGTLTIAENPTVQVDYVKGASSYTIAVATDIDGIENLADVTVTGAPEGKEFRLRVVEEGGKKVLKLIASRGSWTVVY